MKALRRWWYELSAGEVSALDRERIVAVLPLAAVEQHGPHLPLGVDLCIGEGLIAATLQRLPDEFGVLVLPMQAVGYSGEHTDFPGTLTVSPETLIRQCVELGAAVARAGVRRLVLFNSHGGNTDVMKIVIRELRRRHRMLAVAATWFKLVRLDDLFVENELVHGIHGGAVETSVMLHIRPDLVDMAKAAEFRPALPVAAPEGKLLGAASPAPFGWQAQDLNPAGVVGNAAGADAGLGRRVVERTAEAVAALLREVADFDISRLGGGPLPGTEGKEK